MKEKRRRRSAPSLSAAGVTGSRCGAAVSAEVERVSARRACPAGIGMRCRSRMLLPGAPALERHQPLDGHVVQVAVAGRAFEVEEQPPARSASRCPTPKWYGDVDGRRRRRPSAVELVSYPRTTIGVAERRLAAGAPAAAPRRPAGVIAAAPSSPRRRGGSASAGDHAPAGRAPSAAHGASPAPLPRCRAPRPDRARGRSTRWCRRAPRSRSGAASVVSERRASCPRSEVTSWNTARVSVSARGRPAPRRDQRAADEARLGGAARQVQQRGRDVDVADRRAHPARREPGHAHDERHLGLRRVEVIAVLGDAVLAEALRRDRRSRRPPCGPTGPARAGARARGRGAGR